MIWARKKASGNKGNWIYTFRDDSRQLAMRSSFVARAEKNWGEEGCVPMNVVAQKQLGYFSFCSNIDTDTKEIYHIYKERWDIEQCFDYLKNNVSKSASYAYVNGGSKADCGDFRENGGQTITVKSEVSVLVQYYIILRSLR